jgi:hypothetical protein
MIFRLPVRQSLLDVNLGEFLLSEFHWISYVGTVLKSACF